MIKVLFFLVVLPSLSFAQAGFVLERPGQGAEVVYDQEKGFSEEYVDVPALEESEEDVQKTHTKRSYKHSTTKNNTARQKSKSAKERKAANTLDASSKKALVRELMELTPIRPTIKHFVEQAARHIPVNEASKKAKFLNEVFNIRELEIAHQQNLEKQYSSEDLRALITFYKTPEGQSVYRKQTRYFAGMLPTIQSMVVRGALASRHLK